jgi:hypothetical protein
MALQRRFSEKAADAYGRMLHNKARFRMVLVMGS